MPPLAHSTSRCDAASCLASNVVAYTCLSGLARSSKDMSTMTSELSGTVNGFVPLAPQKLHLSGMRQAGIWERCSHNDVCRLSILFLKGITYPCLAGFTPSGLSSGAKSYCACGAFMLVNLQGRLWRYRLPYAEEVGLRGSLQLADILLTSA